MELIDSKMLNRNVVEAELEKLISAARKFAPSLREIRIFGSYNKGEWDSEKSDVDVFIEIGDEYYSEIRDGQWFPDYRTESKQRQKIRCEIMSFMDGNYKDRFSVHILSPNDIKRLWNYDAGKGPIGKNMKIGRLLYSFKSK